MNGEHWAPGKPSFTKPYCGKRGSAPMDPIIPSYSWDSDEGKRGSAPLDPIIPSYSWDSDEETEHSIKPKKTQKNSNYS